MSSSRIVRAVAIGVFATILFSGPNASAAQRVDDPRDPIVRFVKYVKSVIRIITHEDGPIPPHP